MTKKTGGLMKTNPEAMHYDETNWKVLTWYLRDYHQTNQEKQRNRIAKELRSCGDEKLHPKEWFRSAEVLLRIKKIMDMGDNDESVTALYHYLFTDCAQ